MKATNYRLRQIRHKRVRRKVFGTPERPRLSVFRSSRYIYAQIIDDARGCTLATASSQERLQREKLAKERDIKTAYAVGKILAQRAKEIGIKDVVFDRGGYKYHGRVKSLAEGVREGGLSF